MNGLGMGMFGNVWGILGEFWGYGRFHCTSEQADLQTVNLLPAWRSLSEMVSLDASLSAVSTNQAGADRCSCTVNPGLSSLYILLFRASTMKNNKAKLANYSRSSTEGSLNGLLYCHSCAGSSRILASPYYTKTVEKGNSFAHLGLDSGPSNASVQRVDLKKQVEVKRSCYR